MKAMALLVGLMLLLFALPVQAQTVTDVQKAAIEKSLKEQLTQYFGAFEKIDLDAAMKFWSQDKLIGFNNNGQNFTTFEGVKGAYTAMMKGRKEQKCDIKDIKFRTLSPDMTMTLVSCYWKIAYANGNVGNYVAALTEIWVKEANVWKVVFEVGSAVAAQ
jgi:ketosteroid isomerase-like protein